MFFTFKKADSLEAFSSQNSFQQAKLVLIPVPWELTASYGSGSSLGPEMIRKASSQLDFFQKKDLKNYNQWIFYKSPRKDIVKWHKQATPLAKNFQKHWDENTPLSPKQKTSVNKINDYCEKMLDALYQETKELINNNKVPAILGGDHSITEGVLKAIGESYSDYGVLHLDAHHDLRDSYQSFKHSHASVMFNVMNSCYAPKLLLQVGIRDFCKEEHDLAQKDSRIVCYYDEDIAESLFVGKSWAELCQKMISHLPEHVYCSLDVDGLSPDNAPGTGTPVPGGLSFNQLLFLLKELKKQNKKIIGFDVVETAGKPENLWDGNVSARLVYYLASLAL